MSCESEIPDEKVWKMSDCESTTTNTSLIEEYKEWMKWRIDIGMPVIERSLMTLGSSVMFVSPEGIKTIEISEMQDPTEWDAKNRRIDL